jgi:NADP-dependent 3-hydroxy acid dehydrogenase YdfG
MPRFPSHPERRVAVITGASSGIGGATACALAAAGHPVVLGARRVERLEALADQLTAAGGEAVALPLDLADDSSIDAFAAGAVEALGPIDILVSNAGQVEPRGGLEDEPEDFARSVQVNLLGAHRLVHRLAPGLVDRRHGDIVFVTSDVVVRPRPFVAGYVSAKSGLEGLARALQMELEGTGVRVGMVRPGPSSTEQGTDWTEDDVVRLMPHWERWGLLRHDGALLPGQVADAVVAMVTAPKGAHLTLIEIQPEAPLAPDRSGP